eukprot:EG_transcript_42275
MTALWVCLTSHQQFTLFSLEVARDGVTYDMMFLLTSILGIALGLFFAGSFCMAVNDQAGARRKRSKRRPFPAATGMASCGSNPRRLPVRRGDWHLPQPLTANANRHPLDPARDHHRHRGRRAAHAPRRVEPQPPQHLRPPVELAAARHRPGPR